MPEWIQIGLTIGLLILIFLIYKIVLFSIRKVFAPSTFTRQAVEVLRYPFLLLLLLVGSIGAVHFFNLPESIEKKILHLQIVLLLAVFGWIFAGLTQLLFNRAIKRYQDSDEIAYSHRSSYTQLIYLKRLVLFVIIVLTISTILLTIPYIKNVGIGLLSSAGILGIALGIAARPIFLNLMAGFQIAFTKIIQIGDAIFVEGESARVESIHMTHVIVKTSDLRRIIFPISYFIDHSFQNWDANDPEIIGTVLLYCDYSAPVESIRKKAQEIVKGSKYWNGKVIGVDVTNTTSEGIEIRIIMSANNSTDVFSLRCEVREKIVKYINEAFPNAFPLIRNQQI